VVKVTTVTKEQLDRQVDTMLDRVRNLDARQRRDAVTAGYVPDASYFNRLVYSALPSGSDARDLALMLIPQWEGSLETLIETAASLSTPLDH
jgi:pyridoxal/pyridoxine/pyridoxamine kinase